MQFLRNNKSSPKTCFVLLCLLLALLAVSCVSQKPKAQEELPEAVSEQANAEGPNSESASEEKSANTGTPGATAETAADKPLEVLAMYRKSPNLKSVMAVLLLPQIPETKVGISPDQTAKAPTAQASSGQTSSTQATQTPLAQNATQPATQPLSSAAQAQSPSASQPSAKPPAVPTNPTKTPAAQTPQSATPVLPAAPASSTASITALPSSPVPNAELSVQKNQTFSVSLPGNGWIYLGDEQNRQGIRYESRQLIDNTILYRLTGDRAGEFLLRFQRDNPITQAPEFQYIKVTVTDGPTLGTTSAASSSGGPSATSSVSAATSGTAGSVNTANPTGAAGTNTPSSATASTSAESVSPQASATASTGTQGTSSAPASTQVTAAAATSPSATTQAVPSRDAIQLMTDPAAVLELARSQLAQKQVSTVLSALERFLVLSPAGSDEALYLYALAYEQDTPYRDIQKSYQYYKRLVREYPLSTYRQFAMERIAYLERYYPGLR